MISKEAQQAIEMMRNRKLAAARAMKEAKNSKEDPLLRQIKAIYAERKMVDEMGAARPVPNKLTLEMGNADGVHGEWLHYLDADPEKQRDKAILFLHGGGFNTGSALARRGMTAKIVLHAKVDSFSIDYRCCASWTAPVRI
jgi:acetyl esterase/lipase